MGGPAAGHLFDPGHPPQRAPGRPVLLGEHVTRQDDDPVVDPHVHRVRVTHMATQLRSHPLVQHIVLDAATGDQIPGTGDDTATPPGQVAPEDPAAIAQLVRGVYRLCPAAEPGGRDPVGSSTYSITAPTPAAAAAAPTTCVTGGTRSSTITARRVRPATRQT